MVEVHTRWPCKVSIRATGALNIAFTLNGRCIHKGKDDRVCNKNTNQIYKHPICVFAFYNFLSLPGSHSHIYQYIYGKRRIVEIISRAETAGKNTISFPNPNNSLNASFANHKEPKANKI